MNLSIILSSVRIELDIVFNLFGAKNEPLSDKNDQLRRKIINDGVKKESSRYR